MTSLDDTLRTLWNTPRPPLGLLAAVCCGRVANADLTPEERAPFEALGSALLAWWPVKKRPLREVVMDELGRCHDLYGNAESTARLQLALDAVHHQVAAAMLLQPGSVRLHDLGVQDALDETSFIKLVRGLAKHTRTDLELWKGRMEHLVAGAAEPWPAQVDRAARMRLDRPMHAASQLPKPLRELARLADLGATASWSMMGPRHALLLQLGTTKRTAMLDDEARAALLAALPWLV
jgi:hypothetical protein